MIKKVEKGNRRAMYGDGRRTKAVIWRINEEQKQVLDKLRKRDGVSIGGLLDRMFEDYLIERGM